MSRLSEIRLVRQEDSEGCLAACLAMVIGKTYAEVRAAFPREDLSKGGLMRYHLCDYLSAHGFAFTWEQKYCWMGDAKERDVWPVKILAEAAICGVDGGRGGEHSHGVVVLRDGRVFDPAHGERTWADYPKCGYIVQLWDVLDPDAVEELAGHKAAFAMAIRKGDPAGELLVRLNDICNFLGRAALAAQEGGNG